MGLCPTDLENKEVFSLFFFFPSEVSHKDEMLFGVFVPPVSKWVLQGQVGASKASAVTLSEL